MTYDGPWPLALWGYRVYDKRSGLLLALLRVVRQLRSGLHERRNNPAAAVSCAGEEAGSPETAPRVRGDPGLFLLFGSASLICGMRKAFASQILDTLRALALGASSEAAFRRAAALTGFCERN
jgi:hypothetical protein